MIESRKMLFPTESLNLFLSFLSSEVVYCSGSAVHYSSSFVPIFGHSGQWLVVAQVVHRRTMELWNNRAEELWDYKTIGIWD